MAEPRGQPSRRCAGAVLAGGRARRMGGGIKALVPLSGKPMLAHVLDRLSPQVAQVYMSVESPMPALEPFGLVQVPDPAPGSRGPLGGVAATLARAVQDGYDSLLLVPCDAPFLPPDLAARLQRCAERAAADIAVVRQAGRIHPTFSLWRKSVSPHLERAVREAGMAGFMQFLDGRRHAVLDWPAGDRRSLFNINDPEALEEACKMVAQLEEHEHDQR